MRTFDTSRQNWRQAVEAFRPQAIAGTFAQLESLAEIRTATHAIVILSAETDPRLSAEQRDFLWRAFGVPVFEQVVAPGGTLLAAECEAHDGLHVVAARLGLQFDVDPSPCACGRPGARIISRTAKSRAVTAT